MLTQFSLGFHTPDSVKSTHSVPSHLFLLITFNQFDQNLPNFEWSCTIIWLMLGKWKENLSCILECITECTKEVESLFTLFARFVPLKCTPEIGRTYDVTWSSHLKIFNPVVTYSKEPSIMDGDFILAAVVKSLSAFFYDYIQYGPYALATHYITYDS